MKQVIKVLVWIIVLGAVGFGIYIILPEHPHNVIKSAIQPMVDSRAKAMISQIQTLPNGDLGDINYKTLLEANTSMSCWVYEKRDSEPGVEYVIFQGSGVTINLKEFTEYNGKISTSSQIKFEFKITGSNVEIYPYVDGVKMYIEGDDRQRKDANKAIRNSILNQMYGGSIEG